MQRMPVRLNLDESEYCTLPMNTSLAEVGRMLEERNREVFAVVDDKGAFAGVLHTDKVVSALLNPVLGSALLVFDLMERPRVVLSLDDDLGRAIEEFDLRQIEYIPVKDTNGEFAGFVSRKGCFAYYRKMVREADGF
jgi:CIC family chloride channel protein